jgi:hypothetical protein
VSLASGWYSGFGKLTSLSGHIFLGAEQPEPSGPVRLDLETLAGQSRELDWD